MDDYKRLNPKSKKSMYIWNLIVLIIVAAAAAVGIWLCASNKVHIAVPVAIGVAAFLIAIYLLAGPLVFYAFYRYQVSEEKVDVRCGIIFKKRTVVPIERIHQVEIKRGPINNALDLANVVIMTAGGTAVIQYLEEEEADKIAEDLNRVVNRIIRDRQ